MSPIVTIPFIKRRSKTKSIFQYLIKCSTAAKYNKINNGFMHISYAKNERMLKKKRIHEQLFWIPFYHSIFSRINLKAMTTWQIVEPSLIALSFLALFNASISLFISTISNLIQKFNVTFHLVFSSWIILMIKLIHLFYFVRDLTLCLLSDKPNTKYSFSIHPLAILVYSQVWEPSGFTVAIVGAAW